MEANIACFGSYTLYTSEAGPKKTSSDPLQFQPNSHAQLHNMQTETARCLIHPLNVIETETLH